MRRSPLHDLNQRLGARFVDFGGWEMPVQFESVLAEHRAVRESAGVFDVTHLGRFELAGPGSGRALSSLLCNDITRIGPGRCQYSMILDESGGIVDDLIVWQWSEDRFWVMPNAANHERVMAEFSTQADCIVSDLQASTVFLAVQGPEAPDLLKGVLGLEPGRFRCAETAWEGREVGVAGTGYTGEAGAELCLPLELGESLLAAILEAGATPAGLGARDTLRLEAGLPLWGEDIDETTNPLEAGLAFAVSFDHEYVGKEALVHASADGPARRLAGFVLDGKGIPRHGYRVTTSDGGAGEVTSGNISPMLGTGVGLAYLSPPAEPGTAIEVTIRDRAVPGRVAKPPFHRS
jgi:aminomethyltransferase